MKKALFITLFIFVNSSIFAQYNETIRTGRPGQAIGPFTVGANVFQIQAGTDFGAANDKLNKTTEKFNAIGSVFRFGLTEKFEVSTAINYQQDKFDATNFSTTTSGISSFGVGLRNNIYVGKGLIPSVGVQFNVKLPFVDKAYQSNYLAPKITIITGQSLSDKFSFATNWGIAWNGNNANPTGFYILNLGYSITDKIGTFVECYGFVQNKNINAKFDGGFSWLLNNNLQLDISGGYDKNDSNNSDWFVSAGVSWRTKFNNNK